MKTWGDQYHYKALSGFCNKLFVNTSQVNVITEIASGYISGESMTVNNGV